MKNRLLAMTAVVLLATGAGAKDTSIKFASPPYAMTNLVANDALEGGGIDVMHLGGNGFNLNCASYGMGSMDRYWESGGFFGGMAGQLIYGSLDTGGTDPFNLYGFGTSVPLNWFFDPISHDEDDNSLPMYFGVHAGTMQMAGSMSYTAQIIDHYDKVGFSPFYFYIPAYADVTATTHLSMMQVQLGWQCGIQWGINLGAYLKAIPYLDVSQDVYNYSTTDIYTTYSRYSNY